MSATRLSLYRAIVGAASMEMWSYGDMELWRCGDVEAVSARSVRDRRAIAAPHARRASGYFIILYF